jgi:hypothetical protein
MHGSRNHRGATAQPRMEEPATAGSGTLGPMAERDRSPERAAQAGSPLQGSFLAPPGSQGLRPRLCWFAPFGAYHRLICWSEFPSLSHENRGPCYNWRENQRESGCTRSRRIRSDSRTKGAIQMCTSCKTLRAKYQGYEHVPSAGLPRL